VSEAASRIAVHPQVRQAMVALQRELIARGAYVAEGRDIGTVVSPDSPLKVFLTASPEERARRRAADTGQDARAVLREQVERDERDTQRDLGALMAAEDAVELDTTVLGSDEVVAKVVEIARERGLVAA
jgi:cytidylate kinase